ncbi:MAG TPA: MerR family transcriptional regulator [Candidatus Limnocylindrales bacterium]
MRVSELATRTGVSPATIRFYEAEGILPRPARQANGYRDYDDADVCRTQVLVSLRNLGLDLRESARLASLCADDRCDDMAAGLLGQLRGRREAVAAARAELDRLDAELADLERSLGARDPAAASVNLCEGR